MFRARSFNNQSRDHRPTPDPPSSSLRAIEQGGPRCLDFIVPNRPAEFTPSRAEPIRPTAARVGRIDVGSTDASQRRCGTDSVPIIMTAAAQSTTNRELLQIPVLVSLSCDATVLTPPEQVLTVSCRPDIWILPSLAGHDDANFDTASYREFGRRYAAEWLRVAKQNDAQVKAATVRPSQGDGDGSASWPDRGTRPRFRQPCF